MACAWRSVNSKLAIKPGARFGGSLGGANQLDDGVELRKRLEKPFQNVRALLRFAQVILRAAPDHVDAMVNELLQRVNQRQRARLAVNDGQHDHPERLLELRVLVEIVQNHFRLLAALDLNDNAHAIAVRLVADVGDALDFLVLHQLRDALNDLGFVDLEGNLGDDDLNFFLGGTLDGRLGAHGELAAAGAVGVFDPALAVNVGAGGEVRAGNERQHLVDGSRGLVQQQDGGFDDLRQVVRRNLGGHAHGDSVRSVDQQAGNPRGQDGGLLRGLVEVGNEIHGVFLDVRQHLLGQPGQAALRVPVGRGAGRHPPSRNCPGRRSAGSAC